MTLAKQKRVAALSRAYLALHEEDDADWRADVIAIAIGEDGRPLRLEHYVSAVEEVAVSPLAAYSLWILALLGASGFAPLTFGSGDPFGYRVGRGEIAALRLVPPIRPRCAQQAL